MKAELKRAADLPAAGGPGTEAALGRSPEPLPAPLRGGADLHGGGAGGGDPGLYSQIT